MERARLKADLIRHEGFVSHAYQDHLGYWTIGYGRLIDKERGGGISKTEAEWLLYNDIDRVELALSNNLPWFYRLNKRQQDALLNMAFQLGINGLLKFKKMLAALEIGNDERAYIEALDSKWAKQTPKRANEVANMLRNK